MTCREYKELMMGYLDGELAEPQKAQFEQHVQSCAECSAELKEFRKLKKMTDSMQMAEPEDALWDRYWSGVYNRIERGIGWCLMSVAGIALLIYLGFEAVEELVKDPTISVILKVVILALIAGLAVLFVSICRERMFFFKKDRYKDVRR